MNPGKTTGILRMDVHAALISSESDRDSSPPWPSRAARNRDMSEPTSAAG